MISVLNMLGGNIDIVSFLYSRVVRGVVGVGLVIMVFFVISVGVIF